jgi:hypothetical protein
VVVERTNPYRGPYILYHIVPKKTRNYFLYITIGLGKQWGMYD